MAAKEAWKEALYDAVHSQSISGIDQGAQALSVCDYNSRPVIYIKVVQARSLLPPDLERTVDAFVKISLGSSSVKTISRKKTCNPEWGEVFSLDWDLSMRFAKVEVIDEASNDHVLGMVVVPVWGFLDGNQDCTWYKLSRKYKSSFACGEINLEIASYGQPDEEQLVWKLFREVSCCSAFSMPLVSVQQLNAASTIKFIGTEAASSTAADDNITTFAGFPLHFPPIENEKLEDFSSRVSFVLEGKQKVATRGCLFLTNYRAIFVTVSRMLVSEDTPEFLEFQQFDLSIDVPVSTICHVSLSSTEQEHTLHMRTADARAFSFCFHSTSIAFEMLHSSTQSLIHRIASNFSNTAPIPAALTPGRPLATAFETALRSDLMEAYEAMSSKEGPPAQRIFNRLKVRTINRPNEQAAAVELHKALLDCLRRATAEIPLPITSNIHELSNAAKKQLVLSHHKLEEERTPLGLGWSGDSPMSATKEDLLRGDAAAAGFERRINSTAMNIKINLRSSLLAGWDVYDPYAEFRRMGIADSLHDSSTWKITDINRDFSLCPSYPAVLCVPASVNIKDIVGSAEFRSKGRFPTLCWRNPHTKCTISRSAQPLTGLSQQRSSADERLIQQINRSSCNESKDAGEKLFIIIDARPLLNATANQAAGKGYENIRAYENCSIMFMNIDNIHAVRKSYEAMSEVCEKDSGWPRQVESSGWYRHVKKIMAAANRIVHCVAVEELSVLVHCSDGWDRTTQLTSLAMLLLDPFYRTLRGFIVLIEKEWIAFGHRFGQRTFASGPEGWKCEKERSPIFPLWLDCVHQCLLQYPNAFEFNEQLLLFLLPHLYSGWFGNFLFNSDQERSTLNFRSEMVSIWTVVLNNLHRFTNPAYICRCGLVVPAASQQRIVVWRNLFSHWVDKLQASAWLFSAKTEDEELANTVELANGLNAAGGQAQVVWVNEKTCHNCKCCQAKFTFFKRRHHCRMCGQVFCEVCCSEQRALDTYPKGTTQRVCNSCSKLIDASIATDDVSVPTKGDEWGLLG